MSEPSDPAEVSARGDLGDGRARRVALMIDQLEAGGAQRQICLLAEGLAQRGWRVAVLTFDPGDFLAGFFARLGIAHVHVPRCARLRHVRLLRRAIAHIAPDAVIAFLPTACALAELAGLPRRRHLLVAGERSVDTHRRRRIHYALHGLADAVVANSHAQRALLLQRAPRLGRRVLVIPNGVDVRAFQPAERTDLGDGGTLRLLGVGRMRRQKNVLGLVEALAIALRERPALDVVADWYGEQPAPRLRGRRAGNAARAGAAYRAAVEQAIAARGLERRFRLHGARRDVASLYRAADALCLPSHWEGMSNVACEAMASGLPVLASKVGDNPRLVRDGDNGLLFDAASPRSIAEAILRFAALPAEARRKMGDQGRRAASAFSPDAMVARYVELLNRLPRRRSP